MNLPIFRVNDKGAKNETHLANNDHWQERSWMKRYHGIYNIHTYLHVFFSKITMRNLILKIAISTFTTLVGSCFSIILINDIRHRAYGAGGARGYHGTPLPPPRLTISTWVEDSGHPITKNLEEKDGQTQLLCYVSLIRACNKVL